MERNSICWHSQPAVKDKADIWEQAEQFTGWPRTSYTTAMKLGLYQIQPFPIQTALFSCRWTSTEVIHGWIMDKVWHHGAIKYLQKKPLAPKDIHADMVIILGDDVQLYQWWKSGQRDSGRVGRALKMIHGLDVLHSLCMVGVWWSGGTGACHGHPRQVASPLQGLQQRYITIFQQVQTFFQRWF